MNEEITRNDDPFWSASAFTDKEDKLHIYNPGISLEEFNQKTGESQ